MGRSTEKKALPPKLRRSTLGGDGRVERRSLYPLPPKAWRGADQPTTRVGPAEVFKRRPGGRGEGVYTACSQYPKRPPCVALLATMPALRKCFAECARSHDIRNRATYPCDAATPAKPLDRGTSRVRCTTPRGVRHPSSPSLAVGDSFYDIELPNPRADLLTVC